MYTDLPTLGLRQSPLKEMDSVSPSSHLTLQTLCDLAYSAACPLEVPRSGLESIPLCSVINTFSLCLVRSPWPLPAFETFSLRDFYHSTSLLMLLIFRILPFR